jgi:hypothetical protein
MDFLKRFQSERHARLLQSGGADPSALAAARRALVALGPRA